MITFHVFLIFPGVNEKKKFGSFKNPSESVDVAEAATPHQPEIADDITLCVIQVKVGLRHQRWIKETKHPVVAGGPGPSDPNRWTLRGKTKELSGGHKVVMAKGSRTLIWAAKALGHYLLVCVCPSPEADLFAGTLRSFLCSLWAPPLTLMSFYLTACARFKWCAILC